MKEREGEQGDGREEKRRRKSRMKRTRRRKSGRGKRREVEEGRRRGIGRGRGAEKEVVEPEKDIAEEDNGMNGGNKDTRHTKEMLLLFRRE